MHPDECPCCYEMTYKLEVDNSGDPATREPDMGFCSSCGFHYSEHIKKSERDQVIMRRLELHKEGKELDWGDIFKVDILYGYLKVKTEEKIKINLRVNDKYPHHSKITVFVNGANCGDLCLRIEEFNVIRELLVLGIFQVPLASLQISIGSQ